jgi:hypothetical protein
MKTKLELALQRFAEVAEQKRRAQLRRRINVSADDTAYDFDQREDEERDAFWHNRAIQRMAKDFQ